MESNFRYQPLNYITSYRINYANSHTCRYTEHRSATERVKIFCTQIKSIKKAPNRTILLAIALVDARGLLVMYVCFIILGLTFKVGDISLEHILYLAALVVIVITHLFIEKVSFKEFNHVEAYFLVY